MASILAMIFPSLSVGSCVGHFNVFTDVNILTGELLTIIKIV